MSEFCELSPKQDVIWTILAVHRPTGRRFLSVQVGLTIKKAMAEVWKAAAKVDDRPWHWQFSSQAEYADDLHDNWYSKTTTRKSNGPSLLNGRPFPL